MTEYLKTVITPNQEIMPDEPGYKVISGSPIYERGRCHVAGYKWELCREDKAHIYSNIDLVYDFKTIKQAVDYLESIPSKIIALRTEEANLKLLLASELD